MPITVTAPGGVTSFNGRKGAVVLTGADVDTALGYVPVDPGNVVNSFNGQHGAVVLTGSDVDTALGYTPVAPADLTDYVSKSAGSGAIQVIEGALQAGTYFYAPQLDCNGLECDNGNISLNANTTTPRINIGVISDPTLGFNIGGVDQGLEFQTSGGGTTFVFQFDNVSEVFKIGPRTNTVQVANLNDFTACLYKQPSSWTTSGVPLNIATSTTANEVYRLSMGIQYNGAVAATLVVDVSWTTNYGDVISKTVLTFTAVTGNGTDSWFGMLMTDPNTNITVTCTLTGTMNYTTLPVLELVDI